MSIKSTHYVTRQFAIQAILIKLHTLDDEQLGNILEEVIHNGFYNFSVVDQSVIDEQKEEEWPSPYLDDLNNLPEYNNAY
jgi:hypothetical protein